MSEHHATIVSRPEQDVAMGETQPAVEGDYEKRNAHNTVGLAVVQQQELIPTTGERQATTKWEYWTYCVFYFSPNGAPVAINGGALLQLLISLKYPNDQVPWGGRKLNLNSVVLDINGIIFAVQLFLLLLIGPWADYGSWRVYILIACQGVLCATSFGMIGANKPDSWITAEALYIIGTVANNLTLAFYMAAFPGIVQDLDHVRESERSMLAGEISPEEHEKLDSYERSKLNNVLNYTGSAVQVVAFSVAVGVAAGVGYATNAQLIHSYQVLMGFFGAVCVLVTIPYFLAQKRRPGQQLPKGAKWWNVGFVQLWTAVKNARRLKQCILYMFAYFLFQETYGTYSTIVGVLQNEVIDYSPVMLNAMSVVGNISGGSGNLFVFLLQRKFRFSTKAGVMYGAFMTLIPNLWGAIGAFENKTGFHHLWEFWLANAWNFQMAAWASYQVAFLSELIPAPKAYLFFALFNTVGKTSSFIGPFISSAITDKAHGNANMAFWFTLGMGTTGFILLCFVDPKKAKLDNVRLLEEEARALYDINPDAEVVHVAHPARDDEAAVDNKAYL